MENWKNFDQNAGEKFERFRSEFWFNYMQSDDYEIVQGCINMCNLTSTLLKCIKIEVWDERTDGRTNERTKVDIEARVRAPRA